MTVKIIIHDFAKNFRMKKLSQTSIR